jgi:predicted nuclease with TOPRIM domain
LRPNKLKDLKKDYKKKYENLFKSEEAAEKKQQSDIVKDQRKAIRDDFLNNFFIPMRQ